MRDIFPSQVRKPLKPVTPQRYVKQTNSLLAVAYTQACGTAALAN
ncbi:MAG TPA: hypothetical protein VGJ66_26160 [Pyrinomonadaceae bacterium]